MGGMMTLKQSIEEAKLLLDYCHNVSKEIYHMPTFKESEVNFRAETLKGFILILKSDVYEMMKDWEKELNAEALKSPKTCENQTRLQR